MDLFTKRIKRNWLFYQDMPSANQLHEDFMDFMKNRPEFNNLIKIGKSFLNDEGYSSGVVSLRYDKDDRYEMLTERHVFAECASEKLALKIERALQIMATENDILIPDSDSGEGNSSGSKMKRFIVYITCLKKDLVVCPICHKVMTRDEMLVHRLEHCSIRTALKTNILLAKLDLELLPGHLFESREWTIEWQKTTKCAWCGTNFKNRHALHEHEREHCPKNPDKRDKAVCEVCNMLIGARDMPRHMLTHDGMKMWTCEICKVEMRADNKTRHMITHNKENCNLCGKLISKRYMKRHLEIHTNGTPKKICPVCKKLITKDFYNKHLKIQHPDFHNPSAKPSTSSAGRITKSKTARKK
ncbi:hypothetical protein PVAND_008520 [Polypedilum vanderplanki]|uniref:C2H2-type domain-containing protein n=1 Tax=Polypedilum vanderplanki TaxID=319348 RepID=A0A9J6CA84_POLVA|nr:hypothetical protein PVAND_008520 [Polypedilum vanderplanki]